MILVPAMSVLPALLLIGSAAAFCRSDSGRPIMANAGARNSMISAQFSFALDSLNKTAAISSNDNIFYSPHSLQQALTLAYYGASGTTEMSLKRALHIPDDLTKVDVQFVYAFMNANQRDAQAKASNDYEYKSANRLWVTDTKKLHDCVFDIFRDQLVKTDFRSDPAGVCRTINDWVSNVTNGHIRDLLPPDSITTVTDLVLANAVYFKGYWHSRFDVGRSFKDLFYVSGNEYKVTTFMHNNGSFNHIVSEELGAHILELPYKGEEISMFILLPPFATPLSARSMGGNRNGGVRQLIERLSTRKGMMELREIIDGGMSSRDVIVSLPRFSVERELPLGQLLYALGAGELLSPNGADFRGFVAENEGTLHLGDAVHRAKVEVTEEGTTAAGATALFSLRSSRPSEPAIFNANHPFVYFIYHKPLHAILFSGVYRKPEASDDSSAVGA